MLDCPKCLGRLEEKDVEGVKVDICWVCEGIWFDKDELEKVLEEDSKDLDNVDVDRNELDGQEVTGMAEEFDTKTGKCPRCNDGTGLVRKDYRTKIFVDECPKCGGVWLDGGEIHKLRKDTLYKTLYRMRGLFVEALYRVVFRRRHF